MRTRIYINGEWRDAEDGRTYPTFDPVTRIGTTEWGQGAVDTFTRWKTTYINYGSSLRMVFEDTRLR
jgi:hypothetical protein